MMIARLAIKKHGKVIARLEYFGVSWFYKERLVPALIALVSVVEGRVNIEEEYVELEEALRCLKTGASIDYQDRDNVLALLRKFGFRARSVDEAINEIEEKLRALNA